MTYELKEDAQEAIKQFDGANANGESGSTPELCNPTNGMQANLFD